MKTIYVGHGRVAVVDDEDYERVAALGHWSLDRRVMKHRTIYYVRHFLPGGKRYVYLHRFILNAPKGVLVDHRDRDGMNNTRENLRLCTTPQNLLNSSASYGSSRFKGVYWRRDTKKWCAQIGHNGIKQNLGSFLAEIDAARAYDLAARELAGDFAALNMET